jgi:hypothetical protein
MSPVRIALLMLLAVLLPAAAAAQGQDVVVSGGVYRTEIERILAADNLDTSRLGPREVADAIDAIDRGRAPDDFWLAYRAHVAAWKRYAEAIAKMGGGEGETSPEVAEEAMRADQAIEATFDEVERIAHRYGARMPTPPWQVVPTV